MKIISPKPFGRTKDSWSQEGEKISNTESYSNGYDKAFKDRQPAHGHTKIIYTNGKRYVVPNSSTNGEKSTAEMDRFIFETGGLTIKAQTL